MRPSDGATHCPRDPGGRESGLALSGSSVLESVVAVIASVFGQIVEVECHIVAVDVDFQNAIDRLSGLDQFIECTTKQLLLQSAIDIGNDDYQASVHRLHQIEPAQVTDLFRAADRRRSILPHYGPWLTGDPEVLTIADQRPVLHRNASTNALKLVDGTIGAWLASAPQMAEKERGARTAIPEHCLALLNTLAAVQDADDETTEIRVSPHIPNQGHIGSTSKR